MWVSAMNGRSVRIPRARGRAAQCSHGAITGVDEADGHRQDATELSVRWHEGGLGACELCGVPSGNRALIVGTAAVWRLCDDCAEHLMTGDVDLGDRIWAHR